MSNDPDRGTPSFGDLFDDPEGPAVARPSSATGSPHTAAADPADDPAVHDDSAHHETGEPHGSEDHHPAHDHHDTGVEVSAVDVMDDYAHRPGLDGDDDAWHDEEAAAGAVPAGVAAASVSGWEGVVDPAMSSAPAGRVDTGRLYRSSGAEGPATLDAIPALDPSYTPGRGSRGPAPVSVEPEPLGTTAAASRSGLTYTGVVVIVGVVTVVAGFLDALVTQSLGAITGVALAVSSIAAAVLVRRSDIWAAVVVPPLAFLVTALTAGQLTLGKSGGFVIREGFGLLKNLAIEAPWILGTTLVCLVIVLVRRSRD